MSHKLMIAERFSRAATSYAQHNELQRHCAVALLARLPHRDLGTTLDIGCGPAVNSDVLHARASQYLGIDIAPGMLHYAQQQWPHLQWICGDLEQLPIAANTVDTIYANLALQWAEDITTTLAQWLDCLRPAGVIVATTVLQGSLQPLSQYLLKFTGHRRHNQFLGRQDLVQRLNTLKGVEISIDYHSITIHYPSVRTMLHDLKGIGASYQYQQRPPLAKQQLLRVESAMEWHRDALGRLPLDWQIAVFKLTKAQS